VKERAWFYSADEDPAAGEEDPKPLLFWKDTSGRYINRSVVEALLRDGKSGVLDGFTARDGRTYKGILEIDREAWRMKVRSMGPGEGETASASPEYDVSPAPLGPCPSGDGCQVVESPSFFVCQRKLEESELGKQEGAPPSCGFQLPRTVCKREITRDEALFYLQNRKTELLTDFTSRFGRPFSATLVLKENGRHGFEFPPREKKAKAAAAEGAPAEATPSRKPARSSAGPRKAAARKPGKSPAAPARGGKRKQATGRAPGAGGRPRGRSTKADS